MVYQFYLCSNCLSAEGCEPYQTGCYMYSKYDGCHYAEPFPNDCDSCNKNCTKKSEPGVSIFSMKKRLAVKMDVTKKRADKCNTAERCVYRSSGRFICKTDEDNVALIVQEKNSRVFSTCLW